MTHYLPIGHTIQDHDHSCEYTIKGVLGRGASTIAYLADYSDGSGCVSERIIKECYPSSISISRDSDGALAWEAHDAEKYDAALTHFIAGGESQNALRKSTGLINSTAPLQRIFKANNTCYFDVVPLEGRTFDKHKTFTLLERLRICLATAKVLKQYHSNGKLYLDLKPENIFVLTDPAGEVVRDLVVLIDFDSVIDKDKVRFGNSLSFTKAWAAPEQINPHAFRKISEATDIYALGELVFWSVFNRHSTDEEHRGFSKYQFSEQIRFSAQKELTEYFHNTLRPSARNRYQTMQPVIDILERLCDIFSQREYVVDKEIRPNEFFIGRDKEYDELTLRLKEERLVFLSGIGGIGKSELAKQYAAKNKLQYSNILYCFYTGNLEETICQDHISVATVERWENEPSDKYCWRKLRAIKGCLSGNNLLIIDNLNSRIEDIEHQDIWEFLLSLPCEIIVTTRAEQLEHMLKIGEFEDIDALRSIFRHYCRNYPADQERFVDEIISRLNHHTLLIELVAKQTLASGSTPMDMLNHLAKHGISGFSNETVALRKDNHNARNTVSEHVQSLFTMASMTFDQQLLITKAAFMPESGVALNDFAGYHSIDNKNDLNWLIDNGWLYRALDNDYTLSIHPVVAEVVIENAKTHSELLQAFYDDAMKALPWKAKLLPHKVHDQLCKAIVLSTKKYSINCRPAAEYLLRNAGHPAVRYNQAAIVDQLKRAIVILENEQKNTQYSAILEYAYLRSIRMENTISNLDDSISVCKKHLKKAKKAKDLYMVARFFHLMSQMYTDKFYSSSGRFFDVLKMMYCYYSSIFYWAKLVSDLRRKSPKRASKELLVNTLDYGYLANSVARADITFRLEVASDLERLNATTLFCSKLSVTDVQNLQRAIHFRRYLVKDRTLRPSDNSVKIVIDEARILFHNGNFEGAKQKLLPIIEMYNSTGLLADNSIYHVHQFLGNLAAIMGDYGTAVAELKCCLEIGEELELKEEFLAKIQLGRFLNEAGDIAESETFNAGVLSIVEKLDAETRKSYYADTLYNIACLHFLKNEPNTAIKLLNEAMREYNQCTGEVQFKIIGHARCYRKLSEIFYKYGKLEEAERYYKLAKEKYIDCLGENHPEVQTFLLQSPLK